jgi:hydrogenase maturation protein HypF
VVLSGGVFQNRYLIETSIFLLKQSGFDVFINNLVPANDGGISLGQLVIAAKKQKLCV